MRWRDQRDKYGAPRQARASAEGLRVNSLSPDRTQKKIEARQRCVKCAPRLRVMTLHHAFTRHDTGRNQNERWP